MMFQSAGFIPMLAESSPDVSFAAKPWDLVSWSAVEMTLTAQRTVPGNKMGHTLAEAQTSM